MTSFQWPEAFRARNLKIGIVLGSGLKGLADHLEDPIILPFDQVPGLKVSTAPGHEGAFVAGRLGGQPVLCQKGRLHFYEGYSMAEITAPVRLMADLGISTLVLSNAAGSIREDLSPGTLMAITDHINFMGTNPLIGPALTARDRFPDMSFTYDKGLRHILKEAAKRLDIPLEEGVYLATTGPSYETPAEIRAFRTLGADAVGMSTVPEVLMARQYGLKVLAISCLSNMAAGILDQALTEEEVLETGARVEASFVALITEVLKDLGRSL